MATYELTGIQVSDEVSDFGSEGTLIISLPDSAAPIFSYVQAPGQTAEDFDEGFFPFVDLTMPAGTITLLDGVNIQDPGIGSDTYFGQVVWDGSNITWIMNIDFFDQSTFQYQDYIFFLGGVMLPTFANPSQIDAFGSTRVNSIDEISSGPFQPGSNFNINQFPGLREVDGITLVGDAGANQLDGGYDDDELTSLGGNDTLNGGDGNDVLRAGKQEDVLNGGNGDDKLFGQRNADVLNGNQGNDKLNAGGGNDTLNGGAGNDFLKGGTRDDVMLGGRDNDRMVGNSGRDYLDGGSGNDKLISGGENDTLHGGTGDDEMRSGGGDDLFEFSNNHGNDTITDFSGGDMLDLSAFSALSTLEQVDGASDAVGSDLLITTGSSSSILLENVSFDDLSADNFVF